MEALKEMTAETGGVVSEDVAHLTKAYVDTDDVPVLQSQLNALELSMRSGTNCINYQDQIGLQHDFGIEVSASAEIETLLTEGAEHVYMLYTFRSVGRAVPMPSDPNFPNKHELNMKTFEVLQPQIAKIRRLMEFQEKGIVIIERCMKSLVTPEARARVVPDGYYDAITKVIDLLQKLDNLKDMKASLMTDFSRYNRVLQALRAELPNGDQLAQEKHRLQLFLSNFQYPKSLIFQNLRDVLKRIPGHEDVLIEMLQQNIDFIENERYLTPDEKYRLIRSLPHLLLLIDGDVVDSAVGSDATKKSQPKATNVFKDKRVKVGPLQTIFKSYPIVPEYGDMSMTMLVILRRAPHWDSSMEKQWGSEPDKKIVARYSLLTHWPNIKSKHFEFLSRFSKTTTDLSRYNFKMGPQATKYAKFVSELVSEGFKLLQTWTCIVLEAYHWKLTHPKSPEEVAQLGAKNPDTTGPYGAAVKFNYSPRERGVLVDVISMIKSLASELAMAEAAVAPYVRLHVHHEVQQFATGELIPPLHRAHKRNRAIIDPLLKLRRLVADWGPDGAEPADDYIKYSRQDGRIVAKHPFRVVGPSPTQLQLMRTMVRSMYDLRNQLKVGIFSKKDLEKDDLHLMETFYNESLSFQYLLNYSDTLRANSDLADLWYREFYLELSGKIQFPIELSLPWILTEHIIRHQAESIPLVEDILYTMDAYNDAAYRALYVLNQRFLYDEIEAELNLVFDQLVFLIADYAYSHHKDNAAARALDEPYVDRLRQSHKAQKKLVDPPARRLGVPLAQRRVQLLGRVIDLNILISQHVNAKLYKDVEFCLKKFEASDLSTIIDYERALSVVELTRDSLAEQLELDAFDIIVADVDEAVGPAAFAGRALMHVLGSLVTDVIPNYSYNTYTRRFVRSPAVIEPIERPKAPKADHQHLGFGARCQRAYDMVNKLHRGFLGVQHACSIVRVLGISAVPLLVNNLLANMGEKLEISKDYLDKITEGLPPCKLLKATYGLAGVYGAFDAMLKPILAYQDLKPEVFQAFKEIGNTLLFIRDLSDVLDRQDLERLVHAAPYIDPLTRILSQPTKDSDEETPMTVAEAHAAISVDGDATPLVSVVNAVTASLDKVHCREIRDLAETAAMLHRGVLADRTTIPPPPLRSRAPKTSLFHGAVKQLATYVDPLRSSWAEDSPANGVFDLESTTDFHRLWSALSFLFGIQKGEYAVKSTDNQGEAGASPHRSITATDDAQFGHGFFVAGAAIVHLLGQQGRFEALDFTNHVLRVRNYEASALTKSLGVGVADASLHQDAETFARLKFRHRRVFQAAVEMLQSVAPDLGFQPIAKRFNAPMTDADLENGYAPNRRQSIAIKQVPDSDKTNPAVQSISATEKATHSKDPVKPPPPPPLVKKPEKPPSPISKTDTDGDTTAQAKKPPPPPMPRATKVDQDPPTPRAAKDDGNPPPMPQAADDGEEDNAAVSGESAEPGAPPVPPPMPQTKQPPPMPQIKQPPPMPQTKQPPPMPQIKQPPPMPQTKQPPPMPQTKQPPSMPQTNQSSRMSQIEEPSLIPSSLPNDDEHDAPQSNAKSPPPIPVAPPPMPSGPAKPPPPPSMPHTKPSLDNKDDGKMPPQLPSAQSQTSSTASPPPMPLGLAKPPPPSRLSVRDDAEKPPPPIPKPPPPMPRPPVPTSSSSIKPPSPVARKKSPPPPPRGVGGGPPASSGPRPKLPFLAGINHLRQD